MTYLDTENNFFGRRDILDLLKRRAVDLKEGYRQNVAILGNRYVGKSAALKYFVQNLDDRDIIPVYIDLENKDFYYFFSKFAGSLLYHFCKGSGLPVHDDIKLLMETARSAVPHTVEIIAKIKESIHSGKMTAASQGIMTLPDMIHKETGKFCILIFDEFQEIEDFPAAQIFQDLSKKIMTQKHCFYVFASSYPSIAKRLLSEKLTLLFGNFETVTLEPFDPDLSQLFIKDSLGDVRMGATLRNFLTDFTGGHPLYLNLICREIIHLSAIHQQAEVYMPLLSQAVENTIFDRWGVLSRHFELMMNDLCQVKNHRVISSVLICIANGHHKREEMMQDVGLKQGQLSQKLNKLMEQGVIAKNGNFYCFKDKLFKYWIKYIYQKRLNDVELSPDRQRREYKEEFNVCVESFKINSRKDFASRIIELFHCFDNDSFQINGRKYKLPLFRDLQLSHVRNENGQYLDVIRAVTGQSEWLIVLKKDNLLDGDMSLIMEAKKKSSLKPERCLLISMTDVEETIRLKALQERFWIWNEGELNTLLTLYDKPFMVR